MLDLKHASGDATSTPSPVTWQLKTEVRTPLLAEPAVSVTYMLGWRVGGAMAGFVGRLRSQNEKCLFCHIGSASLYVHITEKNVLKK